jgi:hypothetical protein
MLLSSDHLSPKNEILNNKIIVKMLLYIKEKVLESANKSE